MHVQIDVCVRSAYSEWVRLGQRLAGERDLSYPRGWGEPSS